MGILELNVVKGVTDFVDVNTLKDLRPEAVKRKDKNPKTVSTWVNNFCDLDYRIPRNEAIQARVNSVLKSNEEFLKTLPIR